MSEEGQNKSSGSRPQSGTARKASNSRPQSQTARKASNSGPQSQTARKASNSHSQSQTARKASSSRPQSQTARKASSSRPQSATARNKERTSTGRPLEKSAVQRSGQRTVQGRSGSSVSGKGGSNANGRNSQGGRGSANAGGNVRGGGSSRGRNVQPEEKKQSGRTIDPRIILAAAIVIGLILALVASAIMKANLLKVKQVETDFVLGDTFDITNYFEPVNEDTTLEYDKKDFAPEELGDYTIKFTIRRGKLKKTKKATLNIIDETAPYIDGPDEISVHVGDEIVWSDYYTVTDDDPDIQDKLEADTTIDTSEARTINTTISVTDWAGNKSTKSVTVNVQKYAAED